MEKSGRRIAIIFNGSPLFTGDAGSGESNIRKLIIENDMLKAVVALPTELFYKWERGKMERNSEKILGKEKF